MEPEQRGRIQNADRRIYQDGIFGIVIFPVRVECMHKIGKGAELATLLSQASGGTFLGPV